VPSPSSSLVEHESTYAEAAHAEQSLCNIFVCADKRTKDFRSLDPDSTTHHR
jgi:hypothetical protein